MYPLDFTTATARDVIMRSLYCHASTFCDALETLQGEHSRYAAQNPDSPGAVGARLARDHASVALASARDMGPDAAALAIASDAGAMVQALTIACRLQCVPPALRGEIAGRPGI